VVLWVAPVLAAIAPHDKEGQLRLEMFRRNSESRTTRSFRLMATTGSACFRCVLRNEGPGKVAVDELHHADNNFQLKSSAWEGMVGYTAHSPQYSLLEPGKSRTWILDVGDLARFAGGGTLMPGQVTNVSWFCVAHPPTPGIWVALPKDGRIEHPAPTGATVRPILAVFHQERKPPEFLFLLASGRKQQVSTVEPLVAKSRIVASAPALKYTRELSPRWKAIEERMVEPREVGEWRVPWQAVLDLIPKDDLAKIKAAGGDLDLAWKVGDLRSSVLPISLVKPDAGSAGGVNESDPESKRAMAPPGEAPVTPSTQRHAPTESHTWAYAAIGVAVGIAVVAISGVWLVFRRRRQS
jgi:hypothetical protein